MKHFSFLFLYLFVALASTQNAMAQSTSFQGYVGKYEQRHFSIGKRLLADADLELKEVGSSYKEFVGHQKQSRNSCVGKSVPVDIVDSSDQKISLAIKFSGVFPECPDRTIDLYKKSIDGVQGLAPSDSAQLRFIKK